MNVSSPSYVYHEDMSDGDLLSVFHYQHNPEQKLVEISNMIDLT